jgi:hypothetical protein
MKTMMSMTDDQLQTSCAIVARITRYFKDMSLLNELAHANDEAKFMGHEGFENDMKFLALKCIPEFLSDMDKMLCDPFIRRLIPEGEEGTNDLKVRLYERLVGVQREYVSHILDELHSAVEVARFHGWEYKPENVEKGRELCSKIDAIESHTSGINYLEANRSIMDKE